MSKRSTDDLARRYLEALLEVRRGDAIALILDALNSGGLGVADLYVRVFAPVLVEVGERWERQCLSVAQEHFISATTQMIMSMLYPRVFASDRRGRRMVAACLGGDLHEIGLRMVADLLELDGWETYYLGANLPPAEVVAALRARSADLLAISVTMSANLEQLRGLVEAVRADPELAEVRILVGGRAFCSDDVSWRALGADGFASDAASAVKAANDLVDVGRAG